MGCDFNIRSMCITYIEMQGTGQKFWITFVQKVECAPSLVIYLTNDKLEHIEEFCTDQKKFRVFHTEPICNLGEFSTATLNISSSFILAISIHECMIKLLGFI